MNDKEIKSLNEWLNEGNDSFSSQLIRLSSFILPITAIITLLLGIAGALPFMVFLILYLFNLLLIAVFLKRTNRIHTMVSRKHIFLSSFEKLVRSFEREQFKSDILTSVQQKLCAIQGSVASKIRELNNIIRAFDNRLNLFVGLILNGLLLWDFHCIIKLEKWRSSAASGPLR